VDQPESFDAWDFTESPHTVIVGHEDAEWLKRVAAERPARRVLVVDDAGRVTVAGDGDEPTPTDLEAAGIVLAELGLAQRPAAAARDHRPLYSTSGLEQRLKKANEETAVELVAQLRSPMRVTPFVGAGLSAPFGYPTWERFLRETADDFDLAGDVAAKLEKGDYEGAAELLSESDPASFTERVRTQFRDRDTKPDLRGSALSYLPLLTDGPIITTNFDPLIEQAFTDAGRPLSKPIDGPREMPTVKAFHRNEQTLLMIHGRADDATFRVFTTTEFERGYKLGDVTISNLGLLTFTNRPLLILGASLTVDRTVEVMASIHERHGSLWHYAILEASYSEPRLKERQAEMRKLGVRALWYPAGLHQRVPELLREVIERAATRDARKGIRVPELGAWNDEALRGLEGLPIVSVTAPQTAPIAAAMRRGSVSLFLGTYAHLNDKLLAAAFYDDIAETFDVPPDEAGGGRGEIARYVTRERPAHVLSKKVRDVLEDLTPTLVHRFAAALPGYLRSRSVLASLWIFTTNYDTALEDALTKAREPFHVLHYQDADGCFLHAAPDGSTRVIERPEAIRELAGTTVVKLNGGAEDAVVASGQHERLADRIPAFLPACMQGVLRERSLLFLGHSLTEPDVRRLVEFAEREAWAVRPRPATDPDGWERRTRSLENLRVETVDADLKQFLSGLRLALLSLM